MKSLGDLGRMAGDIEMDDAAAAADGEKRGCGGGAHAGKRSGAIDEAIEEFVALFGLGVGRLRKRKIGDEEMIGLETGADFLEAGKAAQEQTGADEEQHRERNFRWRRATPRRR